MSHSFTRDFSDRRNRRWSLGSKLRSGLDVTTLLMDRYPKLAIGSQSLRNLERQFLAYDEQTIVEPELLKT